MRVTAASLSLAAALGATLTNAQYLINDLSFGYTGRVSPPDNPGTIDNFIVKGEPDKPLIYSNKVALTPVSPGNRRGAIWSQKPLTHTAWTLDADFRATGPERGGGNLNFWLVSNGDRDVGASSIYTVGKFDGLVLVVDTHSGSGGMIRGFLNDGSVDYSQHHNVDELAFGHCRYAYRNLGRPSSLKVVQSADAFKVLIDGDPCFDSNKFSIPPGNNLGVTAATPDNPDSIEVFKVTVMSDVSNVQGRTNYGQNRNDEQANTGNVRAKQPVDAEPALDSTPDEDPDIFTTSKTQFADLHNRLQASRGQMMSIFRTVERHATDEEKRHGEVKDLIADLRTELAKLDQVGELQRRIDGLEREMRGMRNDLGRKIQANERFFEGNLKSHHATLSQAVADSVPGHGKLIIVVVGTQIVAVIAYVLYKRRKNMGPKKYL